MSKLEQKLHEFSCRKEAVRNLTLSSWNNGEFKPSREHVVSWRRTEYPDFQSTIVDIKKLKIPDHYKGWLSFDFQGMHYQMSAKEFKSNLFGIMQLLACENGGFRDLSWVGESQDFGVIFEFNENQSPQFEVCVWGI